MKKGGAAGSAEEAGDLKCLNASFRAVGDFKKDWCFVFEIVDAVDVVVITTK